MIQTINMRLQKSKYVLFVLSIIFVQCELYAQTDKKVLVIEPNLMYAIPQFQYYNDSIENGSFKFNGNFEKNNLNVLGCFRDFEADDLWVAKDSNQIVRLVTYYHKGKKVFSKLFDKSGAITRFIKYDNESNDIVYEEWYEQGILTQFREKISEGFYRTLALDEKFRKKTLVDVGMDNKTIQIIHYKPNGEVLSIEKF